MDYNQIKKEYDGIRREIIKCNKKLKGIDSELQEIDNGKTESERAYQSEYEKAKQDGIVVYKNKLVKPIENKLLSAENQLNKLRSEYEQEKEGLTEDNLLRQCSDQQSILEEVRESSELLKKKIQDAIGQRFYDELMSQMSGKTVELHEEDLMRVIRYFNKCSDLLAKMGSGPSGIEIVMGGIEETLKRLSVPTTEKRAVNAAILVAMAAVIVLAYKLVFPVYVVFLTILGGYNLLKTHSIYKILVVQKAVQDNIDSIDQLIHEQVVDELERRILETDEYYNTEIQKMEQAVSDLKESLTKAAITAENTYSFDDSEIRDAHEVDRKRRENNEARLLQDKRETKRELDNLCEQANEYKRQLDDIIGGIQKQYLDVSRAGKECIFEPYFLMDIDVEKHKPIFFVHQQGSSLFIYKTLSDVYKFIRLMCVQLRCKLNPNCLSIQLYDETNLGSECIYFIPRDEGLKKSGTADRMFKLTTDENAFKENLGEMATDIMKRTSSIKREFSDIATYNKAMVELESLTLSYEFVFIVDPTSQLLQDIVLKKVLMNGGEVGLFSHVFIKESMFSKLGETASDLLECIDKIYVLQNGMYNERAKDFVLEHFIVRD